MTRFSTLLGVFFLGLNSEVAAVEKTSIYELPVEFRDSAGERVRLQKFRGQPVVMTMTYSSCPYACPRILQRVKNLQKKARQAGKTAKFVVVTFDPARDTPKRLAEVKRGSEETADWVFLTGTESATRQLSMVLGIRYQKNPEDGNISHDNKILVLDENGVVRKELNGLNIDPADALTP